MEGKTYSQKVESWLFSKSGCHLQDFCRKFGYYPLAQKIMALDENDEKKSKAIIAKDAELKRHYLMCSKDAMSIARKGEQRSWTQYFKDLITGWVMEDVMLELLKRNGLEVVHNGRDAARHIAIGNGVSTEADFQVKVGSVIRKVELSNELNTILGNEGYIEKRSPTLINLWKTKAIWVYRELSTDKYVLIDFATEKVKLHLRSHNTGKSNWAKDVNRYVLKENGKIPRDGKLLIPELISVVGCGIDGVEQPLLEEVEDKDSPPKLFSLGGLRKTCAISSEEPMKADEEKKVEAKKTNQMEKKSGVDSTSRSKEVVELENQLEDWGDSTADDEDDYTIDDGGFI